jgi:hypothetical protein
MKRDKLHDTLAAATDTLRLSLAKYDKAAGDFEVGQAERDRLAAEIASDASDVALDDNAALQSLAAKKQRFELLTSRAVNPDTILPPLADAVREALRGLGEPLRLFLIPEREALIQTIADVLQPFETDTGVRVRLANETQAARQLYMVMGNLWGLFDAHERPVKTARRVVVQVAAILADQKPWLTQK